MRVTKYVHSCLLVEHDDKAVLIDPGEYSWPSIDLDTLPKLDVVLITHIHPDHYYPEALKQLRARQPDLPIVSNGQVIKAMQAEDIQTRRSKFEWLELGKAKHPTPPWADEGCDNNVLHLFDLLTHPGDSHTFTGTKQIMALPITAPWGSMMDAVLYAIKQKPKTVLPIHDWHWQEAARHDAYAKAKKAFLSHGIDFVALETGVSTELEI